jgi:hypothetical protein
MLGFLAAWIVKLMGGGSGADIAIYETVGYAGWSGNRGSLQKSGKAGNVTVNAADFCAINWVFHPLIPL